MEVSIVKNTIWTLIALASTACGEVTAEPIQVGATSFSVSEVEIEDVDSEDAYACEVVTVPPRGSDGSEVTPFISVGTLAYGAVCRATTSPQQCWYTGPRDCGTESDDCGGFVGSVDLDTGVATLEGGQHMLCAYPCVSDADCPAPGSGTALATCMLHPEFDPRTDGGSCMLGCGDGETCPDGFVCIQPGLGVSQSDGSVWPAPAQCVQYKPVTLGSQSAPP
jgi:hypothetical protein